jgi:hypothetical protein
MEEFSGTQFYEKYKKDIFSQNGEDGIIEELLKRLQIHSGGVCEFGAWDGKHLSNTFRLIKDYNFNAVFIESETERYKDLLKTVSEHPTIIPVQEFISYKKEDPNCLDKILSRTPIPEDFFLLSIDIDSYDYQVWKSVEKYKPILVIIEIESSVPTHVENHIHTPGKYQGSGFLPTLKLGQEKGYTYLCHTGNMFFVRNDYFEKLNLKPYSIPEESFRTNWLK